MKGIIIDNDQTLHYEVNSFFRKLINIFVIPVLCIFPASFLRPLRKIHKTANDLIVYAATYKAMEILYHPDSHPKEGRIRDLFLMIWLKMNNSKAVRNRFKLVKRELKNEFFRLAEEKKDIRIINIASGSARDVLESTSEICLADSIKVSAVFVDKNHDAVSFSRKLAESHKYRNLFQWVEDSADNFFRTNSSDARFNIAEIVGLLEYLDDKEALNIFSAMYKLLDFNGILITTNILDNSERRFMSDAIGWKMIYRSADEFSSLLMGAGFLLDKMKVYFEPQRIHCVIVARK